jgi:predicted DNA binding protein
VALKPVEAALFSVAFMKRKLLLRDSIEYVDVFMS